ncbi:MAG: hypothetical protein ACK4NX_03685, partial [Candidatus Paceibacteria bacterium]
MQNAKIKIIILIVIAIVLVGIVAFFRLTSGGTEFIWNLSQQGQWLLPLVTASALLDSINPCALSVLLITMAFLFSIGALRSRILRIGASYILGIFLVY